MGSKHYTEEFKVDVIRRALNRSRSTDDVACRLGLSRDPSY